MNPVSAGAGRGVAITTVGNLFPPLAALISAPILAQSLGVEGRGEVAAGTAPLVLAMSLFSIALPEAITFFIAKGRHAPKRIIGRGLFYLLLAGALGTGILAFLAPSLSGGDSELSQLIVIGSLALLPSLALGGIRGAAIGWQAWKLVGVEKFVGAGTRLGAIVVFSALDALTPFSGTVIMASTSFVGIAVYIALPAYARRTRRMPLPALAAPPLFAFGLTMWAGSLTGILLSRLSQTLMVPLSSARELGLYAVAVSVSEVVLVFNSAVRDVMFSVESGESNDKRLGSAARISTALTVLSAVAVAVVSVWAVPLLFGSEFAPAVPVILILLIGIVLGNPGSVAGAGLSARGRPGLRSVSLAIALVFNVTALLLLVPSYGAIGAAYATVVGNLVSGGLVIFWLRKVFKVPALDFLGVRIDDGRVFGSQLKKLTGRK
jgi:O-antigen/teichoic acid export membrane protein